MGLVAAAFIDIEHMFLPDRITLGGIVLGIATATLRGLPIEASVIGAVVGFLGCWLPFTFLALPWLAINTLICLFIARAMLKKEKV